MTVCPYEPDYAVPPEWILEEHLESRGLSHAAFARRCECSPKLIGEIVAGEAPVEPGTALQFEKVLGLDADIWLGIESDYRLHKARVASGRKSAGGPPASWTPGVCGSTARKPWVVSRFEIWRAGAGLRLPCMRGASRRGTPRKCQTEALPTRSIEMDSRFRGNDGPRREWRSKAGVTVRGGSDGPRRE